MKPRRNSSAVRDLDDRSIRLEARTVADDHLDVKIWLRLLACSTQIEQEVRTRLRRRFAITLPRFDYLAQLERHPEGLRMSALSRYMMVSGGNVTGLTDQLAADGWVERSPDTQDGRSSRVALTRLGRTRFAAMAAEHEAWLAQLLAGFGVANKQALYLQLGQLRVHLAHQATQDHGSSGAPVPTRRSR
jgi:DNA-binding MarR family transcriptional regulator